MFQLKPTTWVFLLALAVLLTVPVSAQSEPQSNGAVKTNKPDQAQEQPAKAEEESSTQSDTIPPMDKTLTNRKPRFSFPKNAFANNELLVTAEVPSAGTSEDKEDRQQAAVNAQGSTGDQESLRKAALNPIASMISVPIQNNMNFAVGPNSDRIQNVVNIQPVIPVKLSPDWNLIMRIITPIIYQPDTTTTNRGSFGLGDINPSFFFSPSKVSKLIWGVGPTFIFPTATDSTLGQGKLQVGPTLVWLMQPGKWTVGSLANNTWSVAGKSNRAATNQGVFQYFINYNLNKGYYLTWQPTITVNWRAQGPNRWLVPFGGGIGRIMKLGQQPVNVGIQVYANPIRPPNSSPFTLRLQLVFLYPKKG